MFMCLSAVIPMVYFVSDTNYNISWLAARTTGTVQRTTYVIQRQAGHSCSRSQSFRKLGTVSVPLFPVTIYALTEVYRVTSYCRQR